MGSRMYSVSDIVYPLTFAVVIALVIVVAWGLYFLGNLPGRIASDRAHPQAVAIGICGWLGMLIFVLWPIALIWAYMTPKDHQRRTFCEQELDTPLPNTEEMDALAESLSKASEQIAAIKSRLAALQSSKKIA